MAEESIEIVKALPGEYAVDAGLLDQVVQHVNNICAVKGLETAREVGEYVLGVFFDGDLEAFHSHGRKHMSLRELAKREDLHVSYAFVSRAVSIVDQLRLLPANIASALPYTHQTLLLPVRDETTKLRLAQEAVEQRLSKRELERAVEKARKESKGATKVGRPALPTFVKTLHKLGHFTEDGDDLWGDLDEAERLDPKEMARLIETLAAVMRRCEALQKALASKAPGAPVL